MVGLAEGIVPGAGAAVTTGAVVVVDMEAVVVAGAAGAGGAGAAWPPKVNYWLRSLGLQRA